MESLSEAISRAWDARPEQGRNPAFENMLDTLAAQENENKASYATTLNEYASYLRVNGLYEYGEKIFLRALDEIAALDGKKTAYATCLSNYAELCRLAGRLDTCADALIEAEQLYEDKNSIEYAANLNYQSNLYQSKHDPRSAARILAKSLAIVERLEPGSIDLATAYQNLGGIQLQIDELDEALDNLNRALSIYETLNAKKNAHFVSLCNTLAMAHIKRGEFKEAELSYDICLDAMKSCKMNPDDIALVSRNAARFFDQQGNKEKARKTREGE